MWEEGRKGRGKIYGVMIAAVGGQILCVSCDAGRRRIYHKKFPARMKIPEKTFLQEKFEVVHSHLWPPMSRGPIPANTFAASLFAETEFFSRRFHLFRTVKDSCRDLQLEVASFRLTQEKIMRETRKKRIQARAREQKKERLRRKKEKEAQGLVPQREQEAKDALFLAKIWAGRGRYRKEF